MKLNWANRITIVRILLVIPFVICMLNINTQEFSPSLQNTLRYIATLIFLTMAVSDGIDGYLARVKGQETRLGAFLDPIADKVLMICACLLLASEQTGIEGYLLPSTVVVLIIGKDVVLSMGFIIVYFITWKVRMAPALIGKIATALQLSMVAATLLAPEISYVLPLWIWVLHVLQWSAAGTAVLATLVYIRQGSRYIEEFEQNNHS